MALLWRPWRRVAIWGALALAALAVVWVPWPASAPAPVDRTIRIEAGDFAFTPPILHANPGDRVTIELVSRDYVHGLHLDGYGLELTADPGETARLTFTADRSGTFRFRCSVTCGALHPFMIGKLSVGPSNLWMRGAALSLLAALAGWFLWRP
jgi:heme/copper-type cytochrome/quinol oxidase subunit 2